MQAPTDAKFSSMLRLWISSSILRCASGSNGSAASSSSSRRSASCSASCWRRMARSSSCVCVGKTIQETVQKTVQETVQQRCQPSEQSVAAHTSEPWPAVVHWSSNNSQTCCAACCCDGRVGAKVCGLLVGAALTLPHQQLSHLLSQWLSRLLLHAPATDVSPNTRTHTHTHTRTCTALMSSFLMAVAREGWVPDSCAIVCADALTD